MNARHLLIPVAAMLLVACDRPARDTPQDPKSKTEARALTKRTPDASSPLSKLQHLAEFPPATQAATLADNIYEIADEDLDLVIEPIIAHEDPVLKRTLLITVFEETQIRPPLIRLPLLVELARQPEMEPSLRVSIMAELGTTLNAEHGESWSDWALAVEEHLAQTEGLIRVER